MLTKIENSFLNITKPWLHNDCSCFVNFIELDPNIPENELDNIWIKFYKVDKARTRAYGGNGIGLSIVKAIMDRHEKKCGAINRPDGVEFWFELDCNSLEKGTE